MRSAGRWRKRAAVTALVLACVVTPLAAVAVFATAEMLNTNRYVDAVEPLAGNVAIQNTVADRITDTLYRVIDVAPEQRAQVDKAIHDFVNAPEFRPLWALVNRFAHDQLVKLLTGRGEALVLEGNRVALNLGPIIREVKAFLAEQGIHDFDEVREDVRLVIFKSNGIKNARTGVRTLDALTWVLPFLAAGLLVAAVALWPNRLRGLFWAGAAIAISSGVVIAGLAIGRAGYLSALPDRILSDDAAAALLDAVTSDFYTSLRVALAVALAVAVAVVVVDRFLVKDVFVGAHRRDLAGAALLGALLVILAAWSHPPVVLVIVLLALLVAGLVAIRLAVREPAAPASA